LSRHRTNSQHHNPECEEGQINQGHDSSENHAADCHGLATIARRIFLYLRKGNQTEYHGQRSEKDSAAKPSNCECTDTKNQRQNRDGLLLLLAWLIRWWRRRPGGLGRWSFAGPAVRFRWRWRRRRCSQTVVGGPGWRHHCCRRWLRKDFRFLGIST